MKWFLNYFILCASILLVGCNPTEQTDVDYNQTTNLSAATFSYNSSQLNLKANYTNVAIIPQALITGYFEVSPALPSGLSLNANTGEISGTATSEQSAISYRITCTTSTGDTEIAFVSIEVAEEPPLTISYGNSILAFEKGSSSSFTALVTGGTPDSFTIDATLPAGLSLNSNTGEISGTPTTIESASFQITATNTSGSTTVQLVVSVRRAVPVFAATPYTNDTQTINVGDTFTNMVADLDTPLVDAEFEIHPALPAGLSLDSDTGTISGTLTEANAFSTYTVRAFNNMGEDETDITINTTFAADTLEYTDDNGIQTGRVVIQKGVPFSTLPTSYIGGLPATYSVSAGALPTGLQLNANTGRIYGTPTSFGEFTFTIEATDPDSAGTASKTIIFSVSEDYPEARDNLGYQSAYTFTTYVPPLSHCISTTGLLADTTLTTEGDCNSTANRVWDQAVLTCYYLDNPIPTALTNDDETICNATSGLAWVAASGNGASKPSNDGTKPADAEGIDASLTPRYEISPALPAGMLFNESNGEITGTPVAEYGATPHTVTAYNVLGDGTSTIETTQTLTIQVSNNIPQQLGYIPDAGDNRFGFWNATLNVFEVQDGVPLTGTAGENIIYPSIPKGSSLPTSYTISPILPDGLSIDFTTGVISGTSTEILPIKYYTITASNNAGSITETIAISTNTVIAPQSLEYPVSDVIELTIFQTASVVPVYVGGRGTFTTSEPLPLGLSLNPNTGEISGIPLIAYTDGSQFDAIPITITNTEGSLTTPIQINIENMAASGLVAVGTADYADGADDDDVVILQEGDSVGAADLLIFSDYATQTGGYLTYLTNPLSPIGLEIDAENSLIQDIGGNGAIATAPNDYNPDPVTYTIVGTAENTGSGGGNTTTTDDIRILVVERAPEISFANVSNRVILQGGISATITPDNNGGAVATGTTGVGPAEFCTAEEADGSSVVATISGDAGLIGPAPTFNAADQCEFTTSATTCYEGLTQNVFTTTITAFNSGTLYAGGAINLSDPGTTTTTTVYAVDGPDFTFEPDVAGETFLTLDASDPTDSYTPTPGLCHQGDFNLTTLSNLPSPLSFSGADGEIRLNDNVMVGRRSFTLSSSRNFGAFTLDQTEDIQLQANHIHKGVSGTPAGHIFDAIQFDFNFDGLNDLLLWDTFCRPLSQICVDESETTIYLQDSAQTGVFDGTLVAFTNGPNSARAIAPFYYDSGKAAVAYVDDANNFVIESTSDTTSVSNGSAVAPLYGIIPFAANGVSESLALIGHTGTQFIVYPATISGNDLSTLNVVFGSTPVNDDDDGGADVSSISFVKSFDMDDDGDNEAVIAYVDDVTADHKICILGNDGTALNSQTCDTRLVMPAGEAIKEIKFADVAGDDLLDMIVATWDTAGVNVLYVYENRNSDFSGLFQNVDTLTLKSTIENVGFGIADINNDGNPDIVAGDVVDGGLNTNFTTYLNTANSSNLFTDLVSGEGEASTFDYMRSRGTTNEIELISTGSSTLLLHCQTDTDPVSPSAGCGIVGSFSN